MTRLAFTPQIYLHYRNVTFADRMCFFFLLPFLIVVDVHKLQQEDKQKKTASLLKESYAYLLIKSGASGRVA